MRYVYPVIMNYKKPLLSTTTPSALGFRFAVDDGRSAVRPAYHGLWHGFKAIFRQEGIRGLYKGVTPNVAGAGTAWGFYFLL